MDLIRIENVRGKERPVYAFTTREEAIKFSKEYLDKHGTGAPPVFLMEDGNRVRVQFDKTRTKGSLRNIDTKTGSRGASTSLRDVDLENTTLDPAMKGGRGFAAVQGAGPVHHAAAARVVGKMHRQFELNLNPDWKPSDGPTPEGKNFLRNIQNRAGVPTGNSPVNLRPYPPDNPSKPTVSDVHDTAHRMGRQLGIDPQTVNFDGYTNDQLFQFAQNKLAPAIKEIDDALGYPSPVKSVGQAGAIARGAQPDIPGLLFRNGKAFLKSPAGRALPVVGTVLSAATVEANRAARAAEIEANPNDPTLYANLALDEASGWADRVALGSIATGNVPLAIAAEGASTVTSLLSLGFDGGRALIKQLQQPLGVNADKMPEWERRQKALMGTR